MRDAELKYQPRLIYSTTPDALHSRLPECRKSLFLNQNNFQIMPVVISLVLSHQRKPVLSGLISPNPGVPIYIALMPLKNATSQKIESGILSGLKISFCQNTTEERQDSVAAQKNFKTSLNKNSYSGWSSGTGEREEFLQHSNTGQFCVLSKVPILNICNKLQTLRIRRVVKGL